MQPIQKKKIDELVYEQLLSNIREGVWKEGDKIPSEPELCTELGISRVTLRSSIQKLQSIRVAECPTRQGNICNIAE